MPLYAYRCDNCGIQFERRQHFDDPALRTCPECSEKALRKLYTPVGVVFKGSGFYSTDHRSSSGLTSPKTSSEGEAEKAESTPKDSESKSQTSSGKTKDSN